MNMLKKSSGKLGTGPITYDRRDRSYHRTRQKYLKNREIQYGATKPADLYSFSVDARLNMRDQNADGYYNGCTGYTQSDNQQDEERVEKDPEYTYRMTCLIEGHDMNTGCQIRNSLKSTRAYGVKTVGENDAQAVMHKGGEYNNVYDDGGYDWFDGILIAIHNERKGVSVGLPWFPSWENVPANGHMPMPTASELEDIRRDPWSFPSWHNVAVKGAVTEEGVPYWLVKPWRGKNIGDKGWHKMSREVANVVMELRGSGAFIQAHYNVKDVARLKVDIIEVALTFLYRMINIVRAKKLVRLN